MQELNALAARVWKRVAAGEAYGQPKPKRPPPKQPPQPNWLLWLVVFILIMDIG